MPLCPTPNERRIEIPWLLARIGNPRRLLDVGHADADYAPELLATGADVTLQDVRAFTPRHVTRGAYRVHIGGIPWPAEWGRAYDLVTCVSVIDHVGLDAYGQPVDAGALHRLCAELWRVTAVGGRLLLTVPVGRDLFTTHPGGGQRVFSAASLRPLFPVDCWAWNVCDLFKLDGDTYHPATWADVGECGYAGWRAEAVACLVLRRLLL